MTIEQIGYTPTLFIINNTDDTFYDTYDFMTYNRLSKNQISKYIAFSGIIKNIISSQTVSGKLL